MLPCARARAFAAVALNRRRPSCTGHKWDYMVKAIMHAPSTTESQFDKETTTQIQNMSRSPARKVYLSTTGNLY